MATEQVGVQFTKWCYPRLSNRNPPIAWRKGWSLLIGLARYTACLNHTWLYRRIGNILLVESLLVIVGDDPLRLGKLQGILHTNAAEYTTLSSLDAMLDGRHWSNCSLRIRVPSRLHEKISPGSLLGSITYCILVLWNMYQEPGSPLCQCLWPTALLLWLSLVKWTRSAWNVFGRPSFRCRCCVVFCTYLSAGRKTGTEADLRLYSCGLTPLSAGGGGWGRTLTTRL